jgi:hypothetical protein
MQSYLTPSCVENKSVTQEIRQVDKTSLISWQSNKYSVPMAYQTAKVGVSAQAGQLLIKDLASGEQIAEHVISLEKGQIIKNTHHYRDRQLRVETLEAALSELLGGNDSQRLSTLLKTSSPKIYKDQFLLDRLLTSTRLTASQLRDRLAAYQLNPRRSSATTTAQITPNSFSALAHYVVLNGQSTGQGESHVVH